jgi:superfamily I DNA/RNA helicase/RecB family exonuclease
VSAPTLDAAQQQVVGHRGGPLLVLAGPGTGKTTTIVEAVVARMHDDPPMAPEHIAVLTFGRAAAAELRDRISVRLSAGQLPNVATFHSFAWSLLREFSEPDLMPQRLLSGPEQDLMIRELLSQPDSAWRDLWPQTTADVLASPALGDEIANFISAMRAHGFDASSLGREIAAYSAVDGPPLPAEWPAAAAFFEHYLTILDMREAVDYSEVIHRATLLVQSDPRIAERFRMIFVDEYQDTDPAQVALIQALAAAGASVVAVGDPDQAIYRFRGADVNGILSFREQFRTLDGGPAPVVVLDQTRRFGPQIRQVADAWIAPVSMGTLPMADRLAHRSPDCVGPDGSVDLLISRTPEEQANVLADTLRRARFDSEQPLRWSDMAVLVRSAVADIPRLRRAFLHAGIPVEVPAGEFPIGRDPSVAPLLIGLRLAMEPHSVGTDAAESFLRSSLIGMTALEVRALQRHLRAEELARAATEDRLPRSSAELVHALLAGDLPSPRRGDRELINKVGRIQRVLQRTKQPGLTISERLWVLWCDGGQSEGRWARTLQRQALAGGITGQRADAVLDVVVELFRAAERMPKGAGVGLFLDSLGEQQIVAARSEDLGFARDCVRLLTAHRAKGLQWPLVVVVGLQQEQWPMARNPATLLQPDRVHVDGVQPGRTRAELVDDERRLAYVAATRAQQRLVLSVVDSGYDGEAPSVLFAEAEHINPAPVTVTAGVADRTRLTGAAIVADLRSALTDERSSSAFAEAAAQRLAQLADARNGRPLAPQAHPQMWWGVNDLTYAPTPLAQDTISLSATVAKSLQECSLQWFLERKLHAGGPKQVSMSLGSLVHAVIKDVLDGRLAADEDVIMERIGPAWELLPLADGWQRDISMQTVRDQIRRFLRWWEQAGLTVIATELPFRVSVPEQNIQVNGSIDLVASDDDGRVKVVDFKTGKSVLSRPKAATDLQLGVYQWAYPQTESAQGATDGAALLYLGHGAEMPSERHQSALTDDSLVLDALIHGAQVIRSEHIVARRNDNCRTCVLRPHCPLMSTLDWPNTDFNVDIDEQPSGDADD